MKFSKERIDKYILDGLLYRQKHPIYDLWVHKYTAIAQYSKAFDGQLEYLRGLILDSDYNIINNPMPKFFNHSELPKEYINNIVMSNVESVTEKMDGSQLLVCVWNDIVIISTLGSFTSEMVGEAYKLLTEYDLNTFKLNKNYTFLFEIIYPTNRIVVDYGDTNKLVLLSVRDDNHNEIDINSFRNKFDTNIEFVNKIDRDIQDLIYEVDNAVEFNNKEGYVVLLKTGDRFKLKYKPYFSLHRAMIGYSIVRLCELLIETYSVDINSNINDIVEKFPDEIYDKVKSDMDIIQIEYNRIYELCYNFYRHNRFKCIDRKSYAIRMFADDELKKYSSLMFDLLDSRPIVVSIYKTILNEFKNKKV